MQDVPQAGGYLTAADDVVQAFHLPKYQHVVAAYSTDSPATGSTRDKNSNDVKNGIEATTAHTALDFLGADDIEMEEVTVPQLQARSDNEMPMTMRELADATIQRYDSESLHGEDYPPSIIHSSTRANTRRGAVSSNGGTSANHQRIPPAGTASKLKGSARKRDRDESERPVFDAKEDGVSVSVPVPTRVLRPRPSKSATQVEEEKERERAYKRAIAD